MNDIPVQNKLKVLEKIFIKKKEAVIFLHDNPDPDSISSGWALQYLLKKKLNVNSQIVYGGIVARAENKAMIKHLKIDISHHSKISLDKSKIYAMVDTQPGGNNSMPSTIIPHIVIDHHPLKQVQPLPIPFMDVRTDVGACVTIIHDYFLIENCPIPKLLATAMYYGITSETQDLGREASEFDQDACLNLFPKSSKKILSWIIHPKNTREYFSFLAKGLSESYTDDNIAYCHLGETPTVDFIHQIADLLLTCENIRWSLCTGWHNNTLYLSLRATNQRAKAGLLARKLVGSLGKAGGHDTMAGGKMEWSEIIDTPTQKNVEAMLTRRFIKYCSTSRENDFKKFVTC